MDIFKNLEKNIVNDSADDTFMKTLKQWDNVLEKNNEDIDSYTLETDASFSNNLNLDDDLNPLEFSGIKFSMDMYAMMNRTLKLDSCMKYQLFCLTHSVGKPFLRFKLKRDANDIDTLLNLLCDCSVDCEIEGYNIYKLPKLLFSFLMCRKFGVSINIFDVEKLLENNTMEEIASMQTKSFEHGSSVNQKYTYVSKTDKYLDIPLMQEFFTYGAEMTIFSFQKQKVEYILSIPEHMLDVLSQYIENVYLLFEDNIFLDSTSKESITKETLDLTIMQTHTMFYHGFCDNKICVTGTYANKFMFIIMRPHLSDCNDVSQYPQITEVSVLHESPTHLNCAYTIDLNNISVEQFDDIIVYGVALDGISDMKNWTKVMNEFTPINYDKLNNNIGKKYSNTNENNVDGVYGIVNYCLISTIFSTALTPVNMEVILIQQNMQRVKNMRTISAYEY
jgi:hypothetical protein